MQDFEVVKTNAGFLTWVKGKYYHIPAGAAGFGKEDMQAIFEGAKSKPLAGSVVTDAVAAALVHGEPKITAQPVSADVLLGEKATFSVAGNGIETYQWQRGGLDIVGATNSSYVTEPVVQSDNGAVITAVVGNAQGKTVSTQAKINIVTKKD